VLASSFDAGARPRKLGVAIVGLGEYARSQIGPALERTEHCRLAGVVTGSLEKGKRWAQDYGFPEANIWNYETMPRLADAKDIDIVYVITPNALHADGVVAAAEAGKHVISEKPFTTTVPDAERALAACRAAGVKLSIGYRLRFDPLHRELEHVVREKTLGQLTKMTGSNGFRLERGSWRAERRLAGGGPLMEMGIYCVRAACLVAGETAPVAVTAREHRKTRPEIFVDVEEGLDWTMEFATGATAEFTTSYDARSSRFRAEGEAGWVSLEPAFAYRGLQGTTSEGPMPLAAAPGQQVAQLDDFALCVREGRESRVSGEVGLRDMRIIEAIYASMRAGGKRTPVNG